MKNNPYDSVMDGVLKRVESVSDKIARNFKGVKPFNKEPIKNSDLLNAYLQMTPTDMAMLLQNHGADKVNEFVAEMEQLKNKRGTI